MSIAYVLHDRCGAPGFQGRKELNNVKNIVGWGQGLSLNDIIWGIEIEGAREMPTSYSNFSFLFIKDISIF